MSDPIIVTAPDSDLPVVSRRNLRHLITRRRNERIAELRDDRWPLTIYCHVDTQRELIVDGDPTEAHTITDIEGKEFMGIPLVGTYTDDAGVGPGQFAVVWPTTPPPPMASVEEEVLGDG